MLDVSLSGWESFWIIQCRIHTRSDSKLTRPGVCAAEGQWGKAERAGDRNLITREEERQPPGLRVPITLLLCSTLQQMFCCYAVPISNFLYVFSPQTVFFLLTLFTTTNRCIPFLFQSPSPQLPATSYMLFRIQNIQESWKVHSMNHSDITSKFLPAKNAFFLYTTLLKQWYWNGINKWLFSSS